MGRVTAINPGELRRLLGVHGLRPSRALGQHFLADPNTARRIALLARVGPGDHVLEIGPGVGSLTVALVAAERARHRARARPSPSPGARRRPGPGRGGGIGAGRAGRRARRRPRRSARRDTTRDGVEPPVQRRGSDRDAAPLRRADHRTDARDGAARGRRPPRRRSGHEGLRLGLGPGRLLRDGETRRARPPDGVPAAAEGRLRARRAGPAPRTTGRRSVGRAALRPRTGRVLSAPQDAAAGAAHRVGGWDRAALAAAGIDPAARAETLDLETWAALARVVAADDTPRPAADGREP